jgi:hypothetical protein
MTEAAAKIPWLSSREAVVRVARHLGCTLEAAELQIKEKADRIAARGVIEGQWVLVPAPWRGTIDLVGTTIKPPEVVYEITNVELCLIDLIAAGLLPAPAEKPWWSAAEAIAYLVKGVPLPWPSWLGAGASPAEIEQAEIDLGELIGAGVPAQGRPGRFAQKQRIPASDFHDMIENKRPPMSVAHRPKVVVHIDGTVGTSPPQRSADYRGPRWEAIEVDSAALRQACPRPLTVRAADELARKPRGPLPRTTKRVVNEIKDDIRAGHFTMRERHLFDGERRALQKELIAKYECGTSTLLDALSIVWSELETPTNSDKK